ncbi:Pentatricopeptide repeat-containing protein At5g64320, mitochondrial [Linum perenne]
MKALFSPAYPRISLPMPPAFYAAAFFSATSKSTLFSNPAVLPLRISSFLKAVIRSYGPAFSWFQNRKFGPAVCRSESYSPGKIHVIMNPMVAGKTTTVRRFQSEDVNGRLCWGTSLDWKTPRYGWGEISSRLPAEYPRIKLVILVMLRRPHVVLHGSLRLKFFQRIPSLTLSSPVFFRCFSDSNLEIKGLDEEETEWERLLKPFDLKELRRCLSHRVTPLQLCKLLRLPLDVSVSMELFQRVGAQNGYVHTIDVYYALIDKLGAAGDFKSVDRLLVQMKEEGIAFMESLFIMIMKHYGRAGFPGQATRLLLDMKNVYSCEITFKSYNVVLEVLVAGNCPVVASNVFYDMLSRGIPPNVYTFSVVMKALCIVNEVDNACSPLRDMTKHGCVPNSVVYQTLIHALSKRDRVDEAFKLLEEMFLMGCRPDVETFNDVIYGLCRLKRIHEGAKLIDRMLLRNFTPNFTPNALCKCGNVSEAIHLFDEMTYNSLIGALCRARAVEKGLGLFEEMMRKGLVPSNMSVNILINGLCIAGKINNAMELLRDMIHRGMEPDIVTYNTLINGFCKIGHIKEALNIFHRLMGEGIQPDVVTYNTLISGHCRKGMLDDACFLLRKGVENKFVPDHVTWNILVHNLVKDASRENLVF